MTMLTKTAQLSLLREYFFKLDYAQPDTQLCEHIESLVVDLLLAGQLESIKHVVIEVQQVWGTLPEKPKFRDGVRFLPQINPLAYFVDSQDTKFLQSISKNYFGFSAAGFALDVPEKLFGKREGYLRSVSLSAALLAHKADFAVFRCVTRSQIGAFLRLLADETVGHGKHWDFVEEGAVDFTNFQVWAFADKMLHYVACTGIWNASGLGGSFIGGVSPTIITFSETERSTQNHLYKSLKSGDGVAVVIALQTLHRKHDENPRSVVMTYEKVALNLSQSLGLEKDKVKAALGKSALGILTLGSDIGREMASDVIDWLGFEQMNKLYSKEQLKNLYINTKNNSLLPVVTDSSLRDEHFSRDLGL